MAEKTAERGGVIFWQWGLAILGVTLDTPFVGFFFTFNEVKFLVDIVVW